MFLHPLKPRYTLDILSIQPRYALEGQNLNNRVCFGLLKT